MSAQAYLRAKTIYVLAHIVPCLWWLLQHAVCECGVYLTTHSSRLVCRASVFPCRGVPPHTRSVQTPRQAPGWQHGLGFHSSFSSSKIPQSTQLSSPYHSSQSLNGLKSNQAHGDVLCVVLSINKFYWVVLDISKQLETDCHGDNHLPPNGWNTNKWPLLTPQTRAKNETKGDLKVTPKCKSSLVMTKNMWKRKKQQGLWVMSTANDNVKHEIQYYFALRFVQWKYPVGSVLL